MKILVLADEHQAIDDITLYLQLRYPNVAVATSTNTVDVGQVIESEAPSLAILCSASPAEYTLRLVARIRSQSEVLLLVLGEPSSDTDRARWLEVGADDVISRPYSPLEFVARCHALLRRTRDCDSSLTAVSWEPLPIQADGGDVCLSGRRVHLTPTEFALLSALAENAGRVVPQNDLIERVWGAEYQGDSDLLKANIYRLRNKLEQLGDRDHIKNDRGFGYRCEA